MTILGGIAIGWVAGIWAASQLTWPGWAWLAAAGGIGGLAVLLRARARWRPIFLALAALALGGWRYDLARPPLGDPGFLATHNDLGVVTLEGVVWDEPDVRDAPTGARTNLRLRVETIMLPGAPAPVAVSGLALVYAPRFSVSRLTATGEAEWRYGDRVRVTGALETPPEFEDYSYREFLGRLGIYSQVRQARVDFLAERQGQWFYQLAFDFKAQALKTLAKLFPEPHAALLSGILLGTESGIPAEVKEAFSLTGTSHIVAISGFNVAILVGIFMSLFSRVLGPNRGAVLTIVIIAAYTALVGAGASVVRAAIMGSLGVVAQRLGRQNAGLNALAAAALLMTIANPQTLWDVGFQLSAAATLGLILYADRFQNALQRWLERRTKPKRAAWLAGLAGELFLITFAAQVTTLPILAYYFRSVSLIALVANLFILPPQPAVMILGGLALIAGLIWLPLGQLAAWLTWPLTAYTLAFVDFFARIPGAAIGLDEVAPALLVVFYTALFGLTWLTSRPSEQRPKWWARFAAHSLPLGGLTGVALVAVLAWSAFFSLPDPPSRLRVTVLDVGQGDGVLIQTPSGVHVLIDGGPSGGALVRGLARHMPLFRNRIDVLVVAGTQDENVGGLVDVLTHYAVERVVVTQAPSKSGAYRALLTALNEKGVEKLNAADLPVLDLGDGAQLRVLADGQSGSTVRVDMGQFALVIPLGLETEGEADLLARVEVEAATALLAAGHGMEKATSEAWVMALDPQVAVISVGAGNALGAPSPTVLGRLAGRTILRTDEHGAISLVSDGQQMWVEAEK